MNTVSSKTSTFLPKPYMVLPIPLARPLPCRWHRHPSNSNTDVFVPDGHFFVVSCHLLCQSSHMRGRAPSLSAPGRPPTATYAKPSYNTTATATEMKRRGRGNRRKSNGDWSIRRDASVLLDGYHISSSKTRGDETYGSETRLTHQPLGSISPGLQRPYAFCLTLI